MRNFNFVALNVNTAKQHVRDSICEIDISVVKNSAIEITKHWLIKPENNEYDEFNQCFHGITPDMTKVSPTFSEVWPEIEQYIQNQIVVADHTAQKMYALKDSLEKGQIHFPSFTHYCTNRISRLVIEGAVSYSLFPLCKMLEINLSSIVDSLSSSKACALLFLKLLRLSEVDSVEELQGKYQFKCGSFESNSFMPQRSTKTGGRKIKSKDIVGDESKIDEDSYFYGKNVCFTGKFQFGERAKLWQLIADIGGIQQGDVTLTTDVLVVGQQDYRQVGESGLSGKQKKAMKYRREKNAPIEIISEAEFMQMINE